MPEELIGRLFDEVPFPGWAFEHAAITETSLMLYFAPELVREELIVDSKGAAPCPYFKYPIDKDAIPSTGVLATARSSSAEKGRLIVEAVLPRLVEIVGTAFPGDNRRRSITAPVADGSDR
ncbi:MAG: creatininase family protein [Anaerotruncus massiliensis (ex Togo et al. 2019)]